MKLNLSLKKVSIDELKSLGFETCTSQQPAELLANTFLTLMNTNQKMTVEVKEMVKHPRNVYGVNLSTNLDDESALKKVIAENILMFLCKEKNNYIEAQSLLNKKESKKSIIDKILSILTMKAHQIEKNARFLTSEIQKLNTITKEMIENKIDIKVVKIPKENLFLIPVDFEKIKSLKTLYLSSNQNQRSGLYRYDVTEVMFVPSSCYYPENKIDIYLNAKVNFKSKSDEYYTDERMIYLEQAKDGEYGYFSDHFVGHRIFTDLDKAKKYHESCLKNELIALEKDYEKLKSEAI